MKQKHKKSHITYKERVKIEGLIKERLSLKKIADNLDRGKTTIGAEIHRNGGYERYNAN